MKKILLLSLFSFSLSATALAMPGAGGGKFAVADSDKDGFLNSEEFSAAFPTLKKEAFGLIDSNQDNRISREEWQSFSGGHGGGMEMQGQSTPPPAAGGALPLLPIPQQNEVVPQPAPQPAEQHGSALPLLTPPRK